MVLILLKWGGKNTIFIFYIVCFVSLTFLLFGGWWLADVSHIHKTQKLVFSLLGYINPFIIGMAVTIFLLVHRMQPTYNSTLNKIVSPNLFIYLFTALCAFGSHINPFLAEMFSRNCLLAVIISFAIILGCLIIGKMIEYVVSHFVDYIFRCVNKRL